MDAAVGAVAGATAGSAAGVAGMAGVAEGAAGAAGVSGFESWRTSRLVGVRGSFSDGCGCDGGAAGGDSGCVATSSWAINEAMVASLAASCTRS